MSTERTPRSHVPDGWTLAAFIEYTTAQREADMRFDAERDRRIAEVGVEREKALKIKEEADKNALQLAREIQAYKDEKANELRSQIERERGTYATKEDQAKLSEKWEVQLKPVLEYVSRAAGTRSGIGLSANVIYAMATLLLAGALVAVSLHTTGPVVHP